MKPNFWRVSGGMRRSLLEAGMNAIKVIQKIFEVVSQCNRKTQEPVRDIVKL